MGDTFHTIKLDEMQREYLHGHATRELWEASEATVEAVTADPVLFSQLRNTALPIVSNFALLDVIGWEKDSHEAVVLEPENPVCPTGKVQAMVRRWKAEHDARALVKAKQDLEIAELSAATRAEDYEAAELVDIQVRVADCFRVVAIADSLLLSMSGLNGHTPSGVTATALR